MEFLCYQDYKNTLLGTHCKYYSSIRPEDKCLKCVKLDKYGYQLYKYEPRYRDLKCECVARGKTNWKVVLVKARGNPIKTKPANTIYEIIMWDLNFKSRDDCNVEILQEIPPTYNFILDFAEKDEDLDYSNRGILKCYDEYFTKLDKPNMHFKGVVSRDSYLKDYMERMEKIKLGCPRKREEGENSHFTARKKGHSHVR